MDVTNYEKVLLGTVIVDQKAFYEVMDLSPQDFASRDIQRTWPHVMDLAPRDALTKRSLIEAMRAAGTLESVGSLTAKGEDFIEELVNLADPLAIKEYRDQIIEASTKRRLEEVAIHLALESRNGKPASKIIEDHVRDLLTIQRKSRRDPLPVAADIEKQKERIRETRAGNLPDPWHSNVQAVSEKIPGLFDVDFMITVGTPGSGKSSYWRYEALKGSQRGDHILTLSYENTQQECQTWAVANITNINHSKILFPKRLSNNEAERVQEAWNKLADLPWFVEEMYGDPLITAAGIIRRFMLTHDRLDLVIIDGMYLMGGSSDSPYEVISHNTQGLRSLAQEIHVPIAATTQFNRKVDKRNPDQSQLLYGGENPARVIMSMIPLDMTPGMLAAFPENLNEHGHAVPTKNANAVVIKGDILKQTNGMIGETDDIVWIKPTNDYRTLQDDWRQQAAPPDPALEGRRAEAQKYLSTYPAQSSLTFNPAPKPQKEEKKKYGRRRN